MGIFEIFIDFTRETSKNSQQTSEQLKQRRSLLNDLWHLTMWGLGALTILVINELLSQSRMQQWLSASIQSLAHNLACLFILCPLPIKAAIIMMAIFVYREPIGAIYHSIIARFKSYYCDDTHQSAVNTDTAPLVASSEFTDRKDQATQTQHTSEPNLPDADTMNTRETPIDHSRHDMTDTSDHVKRITVALTDKVIAILKSGEKFPTEDQTQLDQIHSLEEQILKNQKADENLPIHLSARENRDLLLKGTMVRAITLVPQIRDHYDERIISAAVFAALSQYEKEHQQPRAKGNKEDQQKDGPPTEGQGHSAEISPLKV